MAEIVPMRSVLVTDYGVFEVSKSVSDKIAAYPTVEFLNPFAAEDVEPSKVVDLNHPPMARYYRWVSNHMKREWLK